MITLSELRSRVEEAPLTKEKKAPGWQQLRKDGGGVVEMATFADDSFVEVYAKGYVYYCSGQRWTTFSLKDTTLDYEYESVMDSRKKHETIAAEFFDSLPWIIRVLMDGGDRIEYNLSRARTERNAAPIDSTYDDCGKFGSDEEDALAILLKNELAEMLYESFYMITARQQQVLEACILDGKKNKEVSEELRLTHQAVSDAMRRGIKSFRMSFESIYGDE